MRGFFEICVVSMMACIGVGAGEITRDQLIEGFINYVEKAEKVELDGEKRAEVRKELEHNKKAPLLAPYAFKGDKCNRDALIKAIGEGIQKWKAAEIGLSQTTQYASVPKNLKALSDAELIMAFRLVDQVASKIQNKD